MAVHNNFNNNDEVSVEPPSPAADSSQEIDPKKNKYPGFNLYVKNLDDSFTDSTLRDAFDSFGTITSTKVMCDDAGKSRGFGFVCFENQQEANKALTEMNGRIVGSKPLYVAMAQKKEERKQYLSDKYKNLSLSSNAPSFVPATLPQAPPAQPVREPVQTTPHSPNNYVLSPPVQYRYFPNDVSPWHSAQPGPYIVPPPASPAITYMPVPYQPFFVVPSVTVVPQPPQQMPILHQPIYIHSSKTNTLIYSAGVPAISAHASSPGIYSSTQNTDTSGITTPVIRQGNVSPALKVLGPGAATHDANVLLPLPGPNTNSVLEPSSVSTKSEFPSNSNNSFTT